MCRQYWAVWTSSWANDECRMSNEEENPNDERANDQGASPRDFGIRASSFLGYSSFVFRHFYALRPHTPACARHVLFRQTHHKGECRSSSRRDVEKAGGIDPGSAQFPHY